MKIIFLDIDGVLNSHKFLYDEGGFKRQREIENGRNFKDDDPEMQWYKAMLDPKAVVRLQEVIRATQAKVVISSSWRHGMPLQKLIDLFKSYDIEVIDRTPYSNEFEYDMNYSNAEYKTGSTELKYDERGQEIYNWLQMKSHKYKVTNYAIIDDSSDAGVGHDDYFVRTKWETGMLDVHVDELIRILV